MPAGNADELQAISDAQAATTVNEIPKDALEGKLLSLVGTGNASATTFTVAHGLKNTAGTAVAPSHVVGTPRNQVSSALHWFTFDTTNVTVNFVAAPAAAANNVTFSVVAYL